MRRSQTTVGLALVGDAERGDGARGRAGFEARASRITAWVRLPDLQRVVLHPAGLRIELAVLELLDTLAARGAPSNRMHRVLVVPWSMAATYRVIGKLRESVVQTGFCADDSITCAKTRLERNPSTKRRTGRTAGGDQPSCPEVTVRDRLSAYPKLELLELGADHATDRALLGRFALNRVAAGLANEDRQRR